MAAAAVILAGGSGSRMRSERNKAYLRLAGRSLVCWSIDAFLAAGVERITLVTRPADFALADETITRELDRPIPVIAGGATRHESELAALTYLQPEIEAGEIDVVAIHDGARPLVRPSLIAAVLRAAREHGGAVPGLAVADLVFRHERLPVVHARTGTVARVQTPQAFRAVPLLHAYRAAELAGFDGSDTAACLERFGTGHVVCVPGDDSNLKVTFAEDLGLAEQLVAAGRRPAG